MNPLFQIYTSQSYTKKLAKKKKFKTRRNRQPSDQERTNERFFSTEKKIRSLSRILQIKSHHSIQNEIGISQKEKKKE
jgi:hypothetical protein